MFARKNTIVESISLNIFLIPGSELMLPGFLDKHFKPEYVKLVASSMSGSYQ